MGEKLGVTDVSKALGVSGSKVRNWIKEGAPQKKDGRRYVFDEDELLDWLVKNGKAQLDDEDEPDRAQQPILGTRAELARRIGTSTRVVANWLEMKGFPGRAGKSGSGPASRGFFPLWDIATWLYHHPTLRLEVPEDLLPYVAMPVEAGDSDEPKRNSRDRLTLARAQKAEMELANLKGELIEVDRVRRFYSRQVAGAATIAKAIPSQVVSLLPSDLDDDLVRTIQEKVADSINSMMQMLAELNEGDQDDDDHNN